MHSEFSYDLSIAPKLQRVGSIHIPGWDQPTPDPSFSPPASHLGAIMPTTLGKTTPPGRTSPDQAKEQTDAPRRSARQSIREYELIWLLQQRLRAVSWPHWRLRCMQPSLLTHGMGVVRPWSLSHGDISACHARFMCSAPAFCAWRRLRWIYWKLLIGVCVRDGLAASVWCVYRTSVASVELRPRGWRAVAFPRWLHVQNCSTWLIVILIVRCCFGGLCVRDRLAACLCVSHFCCFRWASS